MEISNSTNILINLGTLITIVVFGFRLSWNLSKFKENTKGRIESLERQVSGHIKIHIDSKVDERLGRIEAMLEILLNNRN